jgi:hypothetical protein
MVQNKPAVHRRLMMRISPHITGIGSDRGFLVIVFRGDILKMGINSAHFGLF